MFFSFKKKPTHFFISILKFYAESIARNSKIDFRNGVQYGKLNSRQNLRCLKAIYLLCRFYGDGCFYPCYDDDLQLTHNLPFLYKFVVYFIFNFQDI